MADIERLQAADTRLTRSFAACVAALAASWGWVIFVGRPSAGHIAWFPALAGLSELGAYIWFAVSAGAAAKALGSTGWHYVVWILLSPILSLIPIPVVSTIIGVSPLSIKFLLGGQLQTAIRDETFAQLHEPTA